MATLVITLWGMTGAPYWDEAAGPGRRIRLTLLVILNGLHFRLVHAWQTSDIWLYLYVRPMP